MLKILPLILANLGSIKKFFSKPFDKNNFIGCLLLMLVIMAMELFRPGLAGHCIEMVAFAFKEWGM